MRSQMVESEQMLMGEVQRIQTILTELISLFQDYHIALDKQMESIVLDLESKYTRIVNDKISQLRQEFRDSLNELREPADDPMITGEILRLKEDILRTKEDQMRIEERLRKINELNCESHFRSSVAIKSIRDVLINKDLSS